MKTKNLTAMLFAFLTMSFTNAKEDTQEVISKTSQRVSCRTQGNDLYETLRGNGYTHRESRKIRRQYVRWCRS